MDGHRELTNKHNGKRQAKLNAGLRARDRLGTCTLTTLQQRISSTYTTMLHAHITATHFQKCHISSNSHVYVI